MPQVFISYSRKDLPFVHQLANDLKNAGFDVWYDVSGIRGGTRWRAEIENGVRNSQFAIVVLSPDSIASEWVEREFLFASNLKRKIIPLYYRQCDLPLSFLDLNYIDVRGDNYRKNFNEILRALNQPSGLPPSPSATLPRKKPNTVFVCFSFVFVTVGIAIGGYLLWRGNGSPRPDITEPIAIAPEPSLTFTPSSIAITENVTNTYTPTASTRSAPPTFTPSLTFTDTVPPPPVYELNYAQRHVVKTGGPDRGRNVGSVACPTGYLVTGLFGNQGDNITGIGLRCSLLNSDGTTGAAISSEVVGQNGGPHWDGLDCPPNRAVSGIGVFSGSYVDQVRAVCSYIDGDRSDLYRTGGVGSGGKENPESHCDTDYYVTGFELKWGDYIDGVTAICTQVLRK